MWLLHAFDASLLALVHFRGRGGGGGRGDGEWEAWNTKEADDRAEGLCATCGMHDEVIPEEEPEVVRLVKQSITGSGFCCGGLGDFINHGGDGGAPLAESPASCP